jgi:hypothetical protein
VGYCDLFLTEVVALEAAVQTVRQTSLPIFAVMVLILHLALHTFLCVEVTAPAMVVVFCRHLLVNRA